MVMIVNVGGVGGGHSCVDNPHSTYVKHCRSFLPFVILSRDDFSQSSYRAISEVDCNSREANLVARCHLSQ
jgi:hypothetical protein